MIGNRRIVADSATIAEEPIRPAPRFPHEEVSAEARYMNEHAELLRLLRNREERKLKAEQVRPFRSKASTVLNPGTNFLIDIPETLSPETGYFWDVRRITVNSFTAGTVTVYSSNDITAAEAEFVLTAAGSLTYSRGGLIVEGGSSNRLIFVTGGAFAGNVDIGVRGILVPWMLLPEYLS